HRGDTQHPGIVTAEPPPGVVRDERAEAFIAGAPRDAERAANAVEPFGVPERVEVRRGAVDDIELIANDYLLDDALTIFAEWNAKLVHDRVGRKAVRRRLHRKRPVRAQSPEGHPARFNQLGQGLAQPAEENRKLDLRF